MRIYSLFNLRSLSSESKYYPSTTKIHKSIKYVTKRQSFNFRWHTVFAHTKTAFDWNVCGLKKINRISIYPGTYPQKLKSGVIFILQLVSLCMFFFQNITSEIRTSCKWIIQQCSALWSRMRQWSNWIRWINTTLEQRNHWGSNIPLCSVCLSVMHIFAGSFEVNLFVDLEGCRRFAEGSLWHFYDK